MQKRDNDFFFKTKIEVGADYAVRNAMMTTGNIMNSLSGLTGISPVGSIIGIVGLFATKKVKAPYEVMLNYKDGGVIPIKAIEEKL